MISTKELVKISGVTSRTIRYYDKMGILCPIHSDSIMRYYDESALEKLQQILFYRSFGISLREIHKILTDKSFDRVRAYRMHIQRINEQIDQLQKMKSLAIKELDAIEKGEIMNQKERFEAFKQSTINQNERMYKKEVIEKYGQIAYEESKSKVEKMDEMTWNKANDMASEIIRLLKIGYPEQNPKSDVAKQAFQLHKKWLMIYWSSYSKEAHLKLAQTYVADERFKTYYDQHQPGLAEYLKHIIETNIAED